MGNVMVTQFYGRGWPFWQCAFVIPKGFAGELMKKNIGDFRKTILELSPWLGGRVDQELTAALASCKTVLVALAVASALINVLYLSGSIYMLEIYDRVGGGDSFASGLVYGLMEKGDLQAAVEYGAAHGALAMTTPGDTSMASLSEVESLVKGGSARVQR